MDTPNKNEKPQGGTKQAMARQAARKCPHCDGSGEMGWSESGELFVGRCNFCQGTGVDSQRSTSVLGPPGPSDRKASFREAALRADSAFIEFMDASFALFEKLEWSETPAIEMVDVIPPFVMAGRKMNRWFAEAESEGGPNTTVSQCAESAEARKPSQK